MCRSQSQGGRRCPHSGGGPSSPQFKLKDAARKRSERVIAHAHLAVDQLTLESPSNADELLGALRDARRGVSPQTLLDAELRARGLGSDCKKVERGLLTLDVKYPFPSDADADAEANYQARRAGFATLNSAENATEMTPELLDAVEAVKNTFHADINAEATELKEHRAVYKRAVASMESLPRPNGAVLIDSVTATMTSDAHTTARALGGHLDYKQQERVAGRLLKAMTAAAYDSARKGESEHETWEAATWALGEQFHKEAQRLGVTPDPSSIAEARGEVHRRHRSHEGRTRYADVNSVEKFAALADDADFGTWTGEADERDLDHALRRTSVRKHSAATIYNSFPQPLRDRLKRESAIEPATLDTLRRVDSSVAGLSDEQINARFHQETLDAYTSAPRLPTYMHTVADLYSELAAGARYRARFAVETAETA